MRRATHTMPLWRGAPPPPAGEPLPGSAPIIGETTYGGRSELADPTGKIDYGSLIYITLQRAKTAREAIATIADLADTYGYASSGESFSIVDRDEAWIMELIGKGFADDGRGAASVGRLADDERMLVHVADGRIGRGDLRNVGQIAPRVPLVDGQHGPGLVAARGGVVECAVELVRVGGVGDHRRAVGRGTARDDEVGAGVGRAVERHGDACQKQG